MRLRSFPSDCGFWFSRVFDGAHARHSRWPQRNGKHGSEEDRAGRYQRESQRYSEYKSLWRSIPFHLFFGERWWGEGGRALLWHLVLRKNKPEVSGETPDCSLSRDRVARI